MFQGISDIFKLLKNAGPLQEQVEEVKNRISRLRVTGEAGAGMVTVTVTGEGKIVDAKIDPNLLNEDEFKMLEDLFIAAANNALEKSKEAVSHEMKSITGLANLPDFNELFKGQK